MKKGIYYLVPVDNIYEMLDEIKKRHITIYDIILYNKDYYMVIISYFDRHLITKYFPQFVYFKSGGLLHYIHLFITKKYRIIGLLFSILIFQFLNQLSYGCLIDAQTFQLENIIQEQCEFHHIDGITFSVSEKQLSNIKQEILKRYSNEISYLDMVKEGKFYKIKCLKKVMQSPIKKSYKPLLSTEDAIVDKIDVRSGNVLVEKGQYVTKGQVVVSNEIISTNDQIQQVEVDGKIYGYVYHTMYASTKGELNPDTFTYLHQQISQKISDKIYNDGYIVSENVLQYTQKEGKIILKMQFTLYQNIVQERFLDE